MHSGNCLGFCPWDLAAFLLAVGLLGLIAVHHIRYKKKKNGYLQRKTKTENEGELPEEKESEKKGTERKEPEKKELKKEE